MMRTFVLGTTFAMMIAGCTPRLLSLPSQGGPAWTSLESEHFTLWTDAPVETGHLLIGKFERLHQLITRAMNNAPASGKPFIIVLRDFRELEVFTQALGYAWPPAPERGLIISADSDDNLLAHELTHVISGASFPHKPRWLSEGLALYFENVTLDPRRVEVEIGRVGPKWGPLLQRSDLTRQWTFMPTLDLFACERACFDGLAYATSWALLSFLINEHFEALTHYMQLLNELPVEQRADAWSKAFPELPPPLVDARLAAWLSRGTIALPIIRVTALVQPASVRPLGDADVHAVRGFLHAHHKRTQEAMTEVAKAIALDRNHVLARIVEYSATGKLAQVDARAAAAAHPQDWRAWWLVEHATPPLASEVADGIHRRTCRLAPTGTEGCATPVPAAPAPSSP